MPEDACTFPHIVFTSAKSKPDMLFVALTNRGVQELWRLRFALDDESVYLIPPAAERKVVLSPKSPNPPDPIVAKPSENMHLSLHPSGEVKITAGGRTKQARPRKGSGPVLGRIATLSIDRFDSFPVIPTGKFNADGEREKYAVVPIMQLSPALPVRVSIYRERADVDWDMPKPLRSTVIVLRYDIVLPSRACRYHALVFQDSTLPQSPGTIAIHLDT